MIQSAGRVEGRCLSVSTPFSHRIAAHPASGGVVVKPVVAGEGLTTAPPDAHPRMRWLDEPTTRSSDPNKSISDQRAENTLPPANFRLKLTAARSPRSGLKPLLCPQDARRHAACRSQSFENRSSRRAALPACHGGLADSLARDVRRTEAAPSIRSTTFGGRVGNLAFETLHT